MATEWRAEICDECGETREREHVTDLVTSASPVPRGWRVDSRRGSWKTLVRRTRFTTLCLCDAP